MKVIFLDVDGVLNSEHSHSIDKNDNWMENEVSEMHIKWLKKIVDETGAKIVLSSSWRHYHPLATGNPVITDPMFKVLDRKLGAVGLEIMSITPDFYGKMRGLEIDAWLNGNANVDKYVIIDDDTDFTELQKPYFVNTTFKYGLTELLADKAINILNG